LKRAKSSEKSITFESLSFSKMTCIRHFILAEFVHCNPPVENRFSVSDLELDTAAVYPQHRAYSGIWKNAQYRL